MYGNGGNHMIMFNINRLLRIATLAALTIVVTVLTRIPFYESIIHLGLIVVIVSSIIFGGVDGALIGGLSMGLYDMFFYNPLYAPVTFFAYALTALLCGMIVRTTRRFIQTEILRYIFAITFAGGGYVVIYFLANSLIYFNFEVAKVTVIGDIMVVLTAYIAIPMVFILKRYITQVS